MPEITFRSDAPLTSEQWDQISATVQKVVRGQLVGRRVLDVFGPLGSGIQCTDYDQFGDPMEAVVDMFGEAENARVVAKRRIHAEIPMIYKDFVLLRRDIDQAAQLNVPFDLSAAAAAASSVALAEDAMVFNALTSDSDRQVLQARDWKEMGSGFQDVVDARTRLLESGFYGPYALVVNPVWFAAMHRIFDQSGVLEIEQVRDLATAGVFQTPVLPPNRGVVLAVGFENFDIAIAEDIKVDFLGPQNLNLPFRVFESLILRLKRPHAICAIEA